MVFKEMVFEDIFQIPAIPHMSQLDQLRQVLAIHRLSLLSWRNPQSIAVLWRFATGSEAEGAAT